MASSAEADSDMEDVVRMNSRNCDHDWRSLSFLAEGGEDAGLSFFGFGTGAEEGSAAGELHAVLGGM